MWELEEVSISSSKFLTQYRLLNDNTTMQICCHSFSHPASDILMYKGIRQSCVLAPMVFTLYLSGVTKIFQAENVHALKLGN